MIMTQVLISNNSLCLGQRAISQQEVLIGVLANNRVYSWQCPLIYS